MHLEIDFSTYELFIIYHANLQMPMNKIDFVKLYKNKNIRINVNYTMLSNIPTTALAITQTLSNINNLLLFSSNKK